MRACILHVSSLFGGGVDRHLRDVARAVPGRHLIWHAGELAEVLEVPAENRFVALDPKRIEAEPGALAQALRAERVGLVHLHSSAPAARARAKQAAKALGVKRLVTLHDVLFLRPDAFDVEPDAPPNVEWLAGTTAELRDAAAVLAPSEFMAAKARQHIPGLEVAVVPNGSAPPVDAKAEARSEFLAHRPRHVVAVLGAIGPHKGSEILEALPAHLEGTDIGVVVIGYLDRQLFPGWRVPGRLFVHGAYDDAQTGALLRAYGAQLVLFPNRVEESFSYALSDAWASGVPVLAAPLGALAERVRHCACGWLLQPGFDAHEVATRLRHLFAHTGPSGLAEVESALSRPDPSRIPTLDDMARSLDAFYRRFAIDPAAPEAADGEALQRLLAANLDGSIFRQELARLADEYAQVKAALDGERARTEAFERDSREWMAKLERDVEDLKGELEREVAQRRDLGQQIVQLQIHKDAFDLLPEFVRKLLLKKILDARN
jgi:glycosyltransferase involved in cell wall biosynthesis